MARPISMESLEAKIEKAEQNVIRTKKLMMWQLKN